MTLADLEQAAGITDRAAFWAPFGKFPGTSGLDHGVAELRRRIAKRDSGVAPAAQPAKVDATTPTRNFTALHAGVG